VPQPADLYDAAVDAGAVGAFEVGEDDVAVVFLDLGVEAADALVVEPHEVAFLAADGDRRGEVAEHAAAVHPLQDLKRDARHGAPAKEPPRRGPTPGRPARV